MSIWRLLEYTIEIILRIYNFVIYPYTYLRYTSCLRQNIILRNGNDISASCLIVLNGPSVSSELSGCKDSYSCVIAVNKGVRTLNKFNVRPDVLVIIDDKLWTPDWGLGLLSEAIVSNSEITFVLNVKWCNRIELKPYKARIIWVAPFLQPVGNRMRLDLKSPIMCHGVFNAAIGYAFTAGFSRIDFLGFDGDGMPRQMLKLATHSYGKNDEQKSTLDFARDCLQMHRGLIQLNSLSQFLQNKGIEVRNISRLGILDMFERNEK